VIYRNSGVPVLTAFRRLLRSLVRLVQSWALAAGIVVLYFVGIGLTRGLVLLFQRRLVRRDPPGLDSYWQPASGYGADDLESPT
jgi:hypothetical protein